MPAEKDTVWGIHAGATGDADHLFLKDNYIALGWHTIGDLSKLPPDREAFKAAAARHFPDKKPGAFPVIAGQLFRFLYEAQVRDIVAYPSQRERHIHLGRIIAPYKYDPALEPSYPNLRPVKWLRSYPRTHFSQGALYEIGSAMSFFQIKTYAEEYRAALEARISPVKSQDDETVSPVAEEIERTSRDFILKQLAQELKGHPLAEFIAHLLQMMGYRTRLSAEGPDGGVDIIAHKDELGFEPPIIKVQVKAMSGSVGDPIVSALYGKVANGEFGLLITLGTITNQARSFERSKSNLRLIDGEELVQLVLEHYEELDSRYKGLIPLKRVWVPQALDQAAET